MKRISLILSLAVTLSLALFGAASAQGNSVTVTLSPQNGSGQSGTATLTAMGNQTQVVINITGEPAGASEPDHIHTGTCANLGGVKYPLKNTVDGTSTTVVNVALSTLQSGTYAINLHKSAAQIGVYVACGDIPMVSAATTSAPTTATVPATTAQTPRTAQVPSTTPATTAQMPTTLPATGAGGTSNGPAAVGLAGVLAGALLLVSLAGRRREA